MFGFFQFSFVLYIVFTKCKAKPCMQTCENYRYKLMQSTQCYKSFMGLIYVTTTRWTKCTLSCTKSQQILCQQTINHTIVGVQLAIDCLLLLRSVNPAAPRPSAVASIRRASLHPFIKISACDVNAARVQRCNGGLVATGADENRGWRILTRRHFPPSSPRVCAIARRVKVICSTFPACLQNPKSSRARI
jgi:hypothetical protein